MAILPEGQHFDRKSLRHVTGKSADFPALARDCVAFANAHGGVIAIGVEDGADEPPPGQRVRPDLLDQIHRRIGELTENVGVAATVRSAEHESEYVELTILRATAPASTS